jgi:hypothetical protein
MPGNGRKLTPSRIEIRQQEIHTAPVQIREISSETPHPILINRNSFVFTPRPVRNQTVNRNESIAAPTPTV